MKISLASGLIPKQQIVCRGEAGKWGEEVSCWDWLLFTYFKRKICIGEKRHKGWRGGLPHYIIFCKKHGPVVTYPQGYAEHIECPFC